MKKRIFIKLSLLALLMVLAIILSACSESTSSNESDEQSSANTEIGGELYQANCASCHGGDLRGTEKGPSHLSKFYEPNHHSDEGFRLAIINGAQQHHWNFGNMPPVEGLNDGDIDSIIAYVRSQQIEQGFE